MNVELFAGTMTRYYSEQWQNAATRQGKRSPFGGKDTPHAVTDPVELQGIIAEWLEQASFKLKDHLKEPLSWQEGMLAPHAVAELGFTGYGGLILLAAYSSNAHLPRPLAAMKTWQNDPAVEASMKAEKKDAVWEIVNCGIWFPIEFAFGIGMKDPSGTPLRAGSIELLWRGLEYLNEVNWGADPDTIAAWRAREPNDGDSFETQTQFGFAVFHGLCQFARENRLPMKLHY